MKKNNNVIELSTAEAPAEPVTINGKVITDCELAILTPCAT